MFETADMVNLASEKGVIFVNEAVLAKMVGRFRNGLPQRLTDLSTHW